VYAPTGTAEILRLAEKEPSAPIAPLPDATVPLGPTTVMVTVWPTGRIEFEPTTPDRTTLGVPTTTVGDDRLPKVVTAGTTVSDFEVSWAAA
jgi:hypothetical protein